MVFQFIRGFFRARPGGEADPRTLVLRGLETVEDVGAHLHLTEILVRSLAEIDAKRDVEETESPKRANASAG
jgi:hypothetical protein